MSPKKRNQPLIVKEESDDDESLLSEVYEEIKADVEAIPQSLKVRFKRNHSFLTASYLFRICSSKDSRFTFPGTVFSGV